MIAQAVSVIVVMRFSGCKVWIVCELGSMAVSVCVVYY